jgi:hypothetical protein
MRRRGTGYQPVSEIRPRRAPQTIRTHPPIVTRASSPCATCQQTNPPASAPPCLRLRRTVFYDGVTQVAQEFDVQAALLRPGLPLRLRKLQSRLPPRETARRLQLQRPKTFRLPRLSPVRLPGRERVRQSLHAHLHDPQGKSRQVERRQGDPNLEKLTKKYNSGNAKKLLDAPLNRTDLANARLPYERLDQLTMEVIAGVP